MTKADIVAKISENTGIEKAAVLNTVEEHLNDVSLALARGIQV